MEPVVYSLDGTVLSWPISEGTYIVPVWNGAASVFATLEKGYPQDVPWDGDVSRRALAAAKRLAKKRGWVFVDPGDLDYGDTRKVVLTFEGSPEEHVALLHQAYRGRWLGKGFVELEFGPPSPEPYWVDIVQDYEYEFRPRGGLVVTGHKKDGTKFQLRGTWRII